ncbi:hypothetical protein [Lysobacter enzymogenes]|uniref:hypothetical protein n=1 Tax=Lysobacter enzymogenes TaxID=69 RepID=UPI001A95842C|nr:hypothetical protein [Lysobacter enzymogenes]QQP97933.1 hypothetical protein JHW38_08000 [Lysobacter enzymogenes]
MASRCKVCNHPERDVIEQLLANNTSAQGLGGVQTIAARFGLKRASAQRHLKNHMKQEQVARLRHGIPDNIEINIEEITRQEGEGAVLGLKRLRLELQELAARADKVGDLQSGIRARQAQQRVYEEQAKLGAMYPGRKQVTNNNLVIADGRELFLIVDRVLSVAPDVASARKMLAQEFRAAALPKPAEVASEQ